MTFIPSMFVSLVPSIDYSTQQSFEGVGLHYSRPKLPKKKTTLVSFSDVIDKVTLM